MKISTKGLYAVRFMVFLAGHGGTEPVPLKEIAEATSISRKCCLSEDCFELGGGAAGCVLAAPRCFGRLSSCAQCHEHYHARRAHRNGGLARAR